MRWYRKSRSEYDLAAESTAGRCGRPAPTTISGAPSCDSSWQAAQSAETSSAPRSCISSMKSATPVPTSVATPAASVSSSTRSISMSPESARPLAAGTSMPGCQRSRSLPLVAPVPRPAGPEAARSANALRTPRKSSIRSGARWCGASSRTAMCSAAATGRRSDWSGRASILPVPHSRPIACDRRVLSSTVLPTPRRPVSIRLRSGRPRATRSSTTSKTSSSRPRPASSGGRCPAPGAYGLRTGSTHRTVSGSLVATLDIRRSA